MGHSAKYSMELEKFGGEERNGSIEEDDPSQIVKQGKRILILQLGQTSQNLKQVILVPSC
jgi:hypothetical protein